MWWSPPDPDQLVAAVPHPGSEYHWQWVAWMILKMILMMMILMVIMMMILMVIMMMMSDDDDV